MCADVARLLLAQLADAAAVGAAPVAAALNALMDLFGDERLDSVAKAVGLVPALEAVRGRGVPHQPWCLPGMCEDAPRAGELQMATPE